MSKFLLSIILIIQIITPINVGGGGLPYIYMVDKIDAYNDELDAQIQIIENELLEKAIIVDKKNNLKKIEYRISRHIRNVNGKLRWNTYTKVISRLESSNRYSVKNQYGYLGKYQIYGEYLSHFGYEGSEDEFLKDKIGQETVMVNYTYNNVKLIRKYKLENYIGHKINNIEVTMFGMMAGAHLVGIGSLMEYLDSDGQIIHKDGNNTSIEKYMKVFS